MIVIVSWAVENNLFYFAQKRWLICDLVISTGWFMIVSWAVENKLVIVSGL